MYEVPSGTWCIKTKGTDFSTRQETVTRRVLRFASYERIGHLCFQFAYGEWFLVIPVLEVRIVEDA